jgi:NAD(P)-dependent dehydrogenase (short-subunit alcohol dehydrogenase family)
VVVPTDVMEEDQLRALADAAIEQLGRIDASISWSTMRVALRRDPHCKPPGAVSSMPSVLMWDRPTPCRLSARR